MIQYNAMRIYGIDMETFTHSIAVKAGGSAIIVVSAGYFNMCLSVC